MQQIKTILFGIALLLLSIFCALTDLPALASIGLLAALVGIILAAVGTYQKDE